MGRVNSYRSRFWLALAAKQGKVGNQKFVADQGPNSIDKRLFGSYKVKGGDQ